MKLTGVKINNYKSFGEKENFLYVNNLNAIVGKNESGKSNLLEALSDVGFIGLSNEKIFQKNNRKSNGNVKIELSFETKDNEQFLYKNYVGKVSVIIEDIDTYKINKEFGEYIVNLKEYKEILDKILILKDEVPVNKQDNKEKMIRLIEMFEKANEMIFVEPSFYTNFCNTLKATRNEQIIELIELFDKMINVLENIYMNFPNFIRIENIDLKDNYTISDLKDELDEHNYDSVLYQLFYICNIDSNNLIRVMESGQSTRMREYQEEIEKCINENFIRKFNEFYSQEKLIFAIDIQSNNLDIMIKSTAGAYLSYSERSNGFKWYISIFIQLLYKSIISGKKTSHILLIDEPGVYLHANAQKELRNLLEELSRKDEQIIYTTHSPFMLKDDDFLSIRALIKDDKGDSHIYNKITTIPSSEKSRYETITPILYALGCSGSSEIAPSHSKLNIITEGITDYYCFIGYAESVGRKFPYRIVPSNGANNIIAIASIIFGWGYDFVILLDQDEKGRDIYKIMEDKHSPFIDKVIFANRSNKCEEVEDYEIENIFSEEDRDRFGFCNVDYEDNKYNYVTNMLTKIKCGEEKYDNETIKGFERLLEEIEKSYNKKEKKKDGE